MAVGYSSTHGWKFCRPALSPGSLESSSVSLHTSHHPTWTLGIKMYCNIFNVGLNYGGPGKNFDIFDDHDKKNVNRFSFNPFLLQFHVNSYSWVLLLGCERVGYIFRSALPCAGERTPVPENFAPSACERACHALLKNLKSVGPSSSFFGPTDFQTCFPL